MANHKSAKKRTRQTTKVNKRNRHLRSVLRNSVKAVRTSIETGEKAQAEDNLKLAVRKLDQAVTKGIMKRRTASRTISRLSIAVNRVAG